MAELSRFASVNVFIGVEIFILPVCCVALSACSCTFRVFLYKPFWFLLGFSTTMLSDFTNHCTRWLEVFDSGRRERERKEGLTQDLRRLRRGVRMTVNGVGEANIQDEPKKYEAYHTQVEAKTMREKSKQLSLHFTWRP